MFDLQTFALGFAGGLTVMGLVWLYFDMKRLLRAPHEFLKGLERGLAERYPLKRDVALAEQPQCG